MMEVIKIGNQNRYLVEEFLKTAGNIQNTFRYFKKRDLEILDKHVVTLVIQLDQKIVAYGHLDQEDNNVWLGIAVAENCQGKNLGNLMMQELITRAEANKIKKLQLSVDETNTVAIRLYKKYGFEPIKTVNGISFFVKQFADNE